MTKRMKWFLGALGAAALIGAASGGGDGAGIVKLLMLVFLIWVGWRTFVFLSHLFKPVREKFKPQVDALNSHVDDALRNAGMSGVADLGNKLQSGIDGAVKETQRGIDQRK